MMCTEHDSLCGLDHHSIISQFYLPPATSIMCIAPALVKALIIAAFTSLCLEVALEGNHTIPV